MNVAEHLLRGQAHERLIVPGERVLHHADYAEIPSGGIETGRRAIGEYRPTARDPLPRRYARLVCGSGVQRVGGLLALSERSPASPCRRLPVYQVLRGTVPNPLCFSLLSTPAARLIDVFPNWPLSKSNRICTVSSGAEGSHSQCTRLHPFILRQAQDERILTSSRHARPGQTDSAQGANTQDEQILTSSRRAHFRIPTPQARSLRTNTLKGTHVKNGRSFAQPVRLTSPAG